MPASHGVPIMPVTTKLDVATELLTEALRLYLDGRSYFSSLHLAGAAEEILGVYVSGSGEICAFDRTKDDALLFSNLFCPEDSKPNPRDMANLINDAKNSTKHKRGHKDNEINFDPRSETLEILDRAIDNYYQLRSRFNLPETEEMRRFNKCRRSLD